MNKTVVISGVSSGLGLAISEAISDKFDVIALGRKPPIKKLPNFHYIQIDFSKKEAVKNLPEKQKEFIKNADVLINNAGVFFEGEFDKFSEHEYTRIFAVNVFTCIELTKLYLHERSEGRIININSVAGLRPQVNQEYYSASKFALRGFFDSLSKSISPSVKVSNIYPAGINTTLWDKHQVRPEQRNRFMDPVEVAAFISNIIELPDSLNLNEIHMHPINEI